MSTIPAYDWLAHHAARTPDRTAAIDLASGRRLDYRAFNERAARFAAALRDAFYVKRGDRVGVLCHNTTDMLEAQFACVKLGAVFLPLNWRLAVPELEYIVNDAAPRVLLFGTPFSDQAVRLKQLCGLEHIVETTGDGDDNEYEHAIAKAAGPADAVEVFHPDLHTVMYTSGTTGRPKGAMITHGMTFWNAVNLTGVSLLGRDSKHLSVLPLFHTGGLNVWSNPVFHLGGTVSVMREFDPQKALELLQDPDEAYTHFFGVPANFLFMTQAPGWKDAKLGHLRCCGVGGAPCALPILEAWAAKDMPLQQGYGMTETSPGVAFIDPEMSIPKLGSSGLPLMHTAVRIVDEQGNDVEPGTVGELWVKGPNVTPGYWNRPDATEESITDGWLHTGDAARRDADGYIFIVDRWKDMYISGGENVYPAEVEDVLYQLDAVAEAAVIGIPDERWGEVGQAVVVVKPGHELTEADIMRHCADKLARYKQPKSVRFVDVLPRNATGKVLKRELRDQVEQAPQAAE